MIDPNLMSSASVYLDVFANLTYLEVPTCSGDRFIGRWDGEVDNGSPRLRDVRIESSRDTNRRLGALVRVAKFPNVATHLLFYQPHFDGKYSAVAVTLNPSSGIVYLLGGDSLRYQYIPAENRFAHYPDRTLFKVQQPEITTYALLENLRLGETIPLALQQARSDSGQEN